MATAPSRSSSPARVGRAISTTLYSLIKRHDPYTTSIVTLEDQLLTECEGVQHAASAAVWRRKSSTASWAVCLRGDPHVVMLSHLANEKTAKMLGQSCHRPSRHISR